PDNRLFEFFWVPFGGLLRRRKIIGDHAIPRISYTGELVELPKLFFTQRQTILRQSRMFFYFVLRVTESESLDSVLFSSQRYQIIFGIVTENTLNRIASGLWNVNE